MEQFGTMLTAILRAAERLLPPGRRQWAEAVRAEAVQAPGGWPQARWLVGGLWLVAKEAGVMRKVMYWIGAGAVAVVASRTIWVSWRAVRPPYFDPQTVTDRVRILAGVAAIVVLPWVGRRYGWFGPVGNSYTARLVRAARRCADWAWSSCGWIVTYSAGPTWGLLACCARLSDCCRLSARWRLRCHG